MFASVNTVVLSYNKGSVIAVLCVAIYIMHPPFYDFVFGCFISEWYGKKTSSCDSEMIMGYKSNQNT